MATTEVSTNVSKRFVPFIPLTTIKSVIRHIVVGVQEKEAARADKYKIPVFASADPMAYIPNVIRNFLHPSDIAIKVIKPNDNFNPKRLPKYGYLLKGFEEYINGRSDQIPTLSFETLATPTGEIILHYTENGAQVFKSFKELSGGINIILSNPSGHNDLEGYAIDLRRDIKDAFMETRYEVIHRNRKKAAEYKERRLHRNIASALTRIAGNLESLTKTYLELEDIDETGLKRLALTSALERLIETGVLSSARKIEDWKGDKFILDTNTWVTYKSSQLASASGNELISPFCRFTDMTGYDLYKANPWEDNRYLFVREGITRKRLEEMFERHLGTYRRKIIKNVMIKMI